MFSTEMGALYLICLMFSMCMYETIGQFSFSQNKTLGRNDLLPSTVSGKASNALRDILNQESLVRFSMVQRIQRIAMDAIDNKNDGQIMKTKLREMTNEILDLETKEQTMKAENAKLKQELETLNVAVNYTRDLTMEEIRNLNETEIFSLRIQLNKELQAMEEKEQLIMAKIKALNESEITYLKGQALALQKGNQNLTEESTETKRQLIAIERKIDVLNSSHSTSKNEIQKMNEFNLENDRMLRDDLRKMKKVNDEIRNENLVLKNKNLELTEESKSFKDQLNKMNETLQKISVHNIVDRLAATEDMFRTFSASVNKTLENVRENLNESSLQWSQVSDKRIVYTHDCDDCLEILRKFPSLKGRDGVYPLYLTSKLTFVYCDMSTEGGGWTAIQRRQDGSTDFFRTWTEYKQGFGDPSTNYWIGNDAIYGLTKNKDQELRVELKSFDGAEAYAQYSTFYVGDESSKYNLTVSGYSGTAGDSLKYHSGSTFSSKDQDNDGNSIEFCAISRHGAWWYSNCANTNLNGEYAQSALTGDKYISWFHWKNKREALQNTKMMIRHKT